MNNNSQTKSSLFRQIFNKKRQEGGQHIKDININFSVLIASQKKPKQSVSKERFLIHSNSQTPRRKNISPAINNYFVKPDAQEKPSPRVSKRFVVSQYTQQHKDKKNLSVQNMAQLFLKHCQREFNKFMASIDYQGAAHKLQLLSNWKIIFQKLIDLLTICLGLTEEEEQLDIKFREIAKTISLLKNIVVQSYFQLQQGKVHYHRCKYFKAITYLKASKNNIKYGDYWLLRMRAYYYISKSLTEIKQYPLSLLYASKFLLSSWFLNDVKFELRAFEAFGINYYYISDMQKARYFHSRSVNGTYESQTSELKRIGQRKVQRQIIQLQEEFQIQKKTKKTNEKYRQSAIKFEVSSSDDEILELPVEDIEDDKDFRKLGVLRKAIQEKLNSHLQHEKYRDLQKHHNFYIRQKNDGDNEQSYSNQLYYAVQTTSEGYQKKNCQIQEKINTPQSFNHLSFTREMRNYEISQGDRIDELSIAQCRQYNRTKKIRSIITKTSQIFKFCLQAINKEIESGLGGELKFV